MKPLEPLEAVPITHGVAMVKVDPAAKYVVFVSATGIGMDVEIFVHHFSTDANNPLPAGTPIYVVDDIDRAVRIYEILDTKVGSSGS
jgi:DMSO/TMAO reductase YedYZ molybdopterin-dependent catalytic subunit